MDTKNSNYHTQQNIDNIAKMREVLETLQIGRAHV